MLENLSALTFYRKDYLDTNSVAYSSQYACIDSIFEVECSEIKQTTSSLKRFIRNCQIELKGEANETDELIGEKEEENPPKAAVELIVSELANESIIPFPFQQLAFDVDAGEWRQLYRPLHVFNEKLKD